MSLPQQLHPPSAPTNARPARAREQTRQHTRGPALLSVPTQSLLCPKDTDTGRAACAVCTSQESPQELQNCSLHLSRLLCSCTWELHECRSRSVDLGGTQAAARTRLGRHCSWPGAFLPPLLAHPAALGPSPLCPPCATSSCMHTSHSLLPATAPAGTQHGPARAPC